jgi:hypothetical protein
MISSSKQGTSSRLVAAGSVFGLGLASAAVGMVVAAGSATAAPQGPDPKVVVCKYVGTPGQGERLQTGQNPIEVSANALKGFGGTFPFQFADAHGRSIAIGYVGNAGSCPAPDTGPTEDPTLPAEDPTQPAEDPTEDPGDQSGDQGDQSGDQGDQGGDQGDQGGDQGDQGGDQGDQGGDQGDQVGDQTDEPTDTPSDTPSDTPTDETGGQTGDKTGDGSTDDPTDQPTDETTVLPTEIVTEDDPGTTPEDTPSTEPTVLPTEIVIDPAGDPTPSDTPATEPTVLPTEIVVVDHPRHPGHQQPSAVAPAAVPTSIDAGLAGTPAPTGTSGNLGRLLTLLGFGLALLGAGFGLVPARPRGRHTA